MRAAVVRAGASDSSSTDSPAATTPAAPASGSGLSLTPVDANGAPASPAAPTPRAVAKAPAPSVAKVRCMTACCQSAGTSAEAFFKARNIVSSGASFPLNLVPADDTYAALPGTCSEASRTEGCTCLGWTFTDTHES